MTDPQRGWRSSAARAGELRQQRRWPTYVGITGLLLLIIVGLAGGIIWYDSEKSDELAITTARRLMQEADQKIIDRIRLLYDPMYAIVGIASMVPDLTTPAAGDNASAKALLFRALQTYPQILSLYVGFDNGEFFMVTHIAGDNADALRKALQAPPDAVFAIETALTGADGERRANWLFLAQDGAVAGRRDQTENVIEPRQRPWFSAARDTDVVEHSGLYVFASSGEPGFTLSRSFRGPTPGVMGADLAAVDLADFLRQQRITPSSIAFIFTKEGQVIAVPDKAEMARAVGNVGQAKTDPPKIADLHDPVISGLVSAYQDQPMTGSRVYNVAGRTYIGRVIDIPPRYGDGQRLAIAVPVDEIIEPIAAIRNDTLIYSVAFLVFALPLYVVLVAVWLDRKLERHAASRTFRDDE